VGLLGFSVVLPSGQTAADVEVHLPAGTNPNAYFKLHGGVWVDFTANADFAGDVVTLHLVDGGVGDADGAVNGVIVDPGGPATIAGPEYGFGGFSAPVDAPPLVNSAKAGQTIPVKWRITDADGVPISDPASFVSITSRGSSCTAADTDVIETYAGGTGLQYLGDGRWQFNWKTPKAYAGQCRTMRLNLADGVSTRVAEFRFR
jgi:hypothetical protein